MTTTTITRPCPGLDGAGCGQPLEADLDVCDGCDGRRAHAALVNELHEGLAHQSVLVGEALDELQEKFSELTADPHHRDDGLNGSIAGLDMRRELEAVRRHLGNLIEIHTGYLAERRAKADTQP